MNIDFLLNYLRRVFSDSVIGGIFLITVAILVLVIVNHSTGFTHHYDLSRQIDEFRKMQESTNSDSAAAARMDSIRMSIAAQMRERQTPPTPAEERKIRIFTAIPLGLLLVLLNIGAHWESEAELLDPMTTWYNAKGYIFALGIPFFSVVTVPPQGSLIGAFTMTIVSQIGVLTFIALYLMVLGPAVHLAMGRTSTSEEKNDD